MSKQNVADRLSDLFFVRFGNDWREEVSLTLRADALFWLVHLAEKGIDSRKEDFKSKSGNLDASAIASLSSWQSDLENLLVKITAAITPPAKG